MLRALYEKSIPACQAYCGLCESVLRVVVGDGGVIVRVVFANDVLTLLLRDNSRSYICISIRFYIPGYMYVRLIICL
jgi:hypothetical protein